MKWLIHCMVMLLAAIPGSGAKAQHRVIIEASAERRLPLLWQYCTTHNLSDQDSVVTHRFFNHVIRGADSLHDRRLKSYAQYFQQCWRIFFSEHYETHFSGERYKSAVNILANAQEWALQNNYADIAASCEHTIGQAYYVANRYGPAFEHLLKADNAFKKIGYRQVPNAAFYLYSLGLCFYRFEEYDKALQQLLQSTQYEFYLPRIEINTFNTVGLIYARIHKPAEAISFFRCTINKARQYRDTTWIGIGSGNLGNVLLSGNHYDSALFYHRQNYAINSNPYFKAPEDAAITALSMATIFIRERQLDSALLYIRSGSTLGARYIRDTTARFDFHKRVLKVRIDYLKAKEDFRMALLLADSLLMVEKALTKRLDSKILSRAIEKIEASSYESRLRLLKSQKDLVQLRFYFIIAMLPVLLILVGLIFRDKWLRKKRQIQLAEKDKQILLAEKLRAEDKLKHAEELLNSYIHTIKEKTTIIEHLESELTGYKKATLHTPESMALTSKREKLMVNTILTDAEWQQFRILFEQVYPGFSYRLKEAYPNLSPAETRFVYLTKLNLTSREMATMVGISVEGIHKLRYRLRKKLNLEEADSFESVIQGIG